MLWGGEVGCEGGDEGRERERERIGRNREG